MAPLAPLALLALLAPGIPQAPVGLPRQRARSPPPQRAWAGIPAQRSAQVSVQAPAHAPGQAVVQPLALLQGRARAAWPRRGCAATQSHRWLPAERAVLAGWKPQRPPPTPRRPPANAPRWLPAGRPVPRGWKLRGPPPAPLQPPGAGRPQKRALATAPPAWAGWRVPAARAALLALARAVHPARRVSQGPPQRAVRAWEWVFS